MRLTSPSRRAAGLLAASTIGLSTAVLSVTGAASASTPTITHFSTDADDPTADEDFAGIFVLPTDGDCTIVWDVAGAAGGAGAGAGGSLGAGTGGHVTVTTQSTDSAAFLLRWGGQGEAATYAAGAEGSIGHGGYNGAKQDGYTGSDGQDGDHDADADEYGGGGGAASVVLTYDGDLVAAAYGGNGGGDAGGPGGLNGSNAFAPGVTGATEGDANEGEGVIRGTATCTVPDEPTGGDNTGSNGGQEATVTGAPDVKWVDGVTNGLQFQLWITSVASDDPVTGVEYSFDNGSHWVGLDTDNAGDFQYSGTITGLRAGTSYSVSFRFATAKGHTDASPATTATTAVPGPQNVTAVAGASSIKVTWAAPADLTGVAGYLASATPEGDQSSARTVFCKPADALGTSCVLGAIPGLKYGVAVASLNAQGERIGASDWVTSDVVSAPNIAATLPTASAPLTSSDTDGKVEVGDTITLTGDGYLPGSTVELVVYSTPVSLGSTVADANGRFSITVTLPTTMANGTHHLVASGVDANGNPRYLVSEILVSGGTGLAYTGFSAMPYIGGGLVALLAGAGLLVASRRRAG